MDAIVEQKALTAGAAVDSAKSIPASMRSRSGRLLKHLDKLTNNNRSWRVLPTDMAGLLHAAGEKVAALKAGDAVEVLGANTIAELVALDATHARCNSQVA